MGRKDIIKNNESTTYNGDLSIEKISRFDWSYFSNLSALLLHGFIARYCSLSHLLLVPVLISS